MKCERCGRDNAEHLTFCEDCGFALGRKRGDAPKATTGSHARPQAPSFQIGPPKNAAPKDVALTCRACKTRNEPGHRFCVACGSPLGDAAPVAAAPPPPPPPDRSVVAGADLKRPTRPDGLAALAVAGGIASPAPVIHAATPAPSPATVTCPRCRTTVETGLAFCRLCGYALTTATSPSPQNGPTTPPPTVESCEAGATPEGAARAKYQTMPIVKTGGRLVVITRDGTDGASFPLAGDQIDIGAREGDIVLGEDPFLSPRHARLERDPTSGRWYIADLGSVNGVYLRIRRARPLTDGDLILLGQEVLRFEVVTDAEQGLRPATQHGVAVFGTPATARYARLVQRSVEGVARDVYYLHRAETYLGREGTDIVFSDDPFLSRRHAVIRYDPASRSTTLEDAGSSNGTFAAIRGREALADGDIVRVGLHVLRVELGQGAAPGGARS